MAGEVDTDTTESGGSFLERQKIPEMTIEQSWTANEVRKKIGGLEFSPPGDDGVEATSDGVLFSQETENGEESTVGRVVRTLDEDGSSIVEFQLKTETTKSVSFGKGKSISRGSDWQTVAQAQCTEDGRVLELTAGEIPEDLGIDVVGEDTAPGERLEEEDKVTKLVTSVIVAVIGPKTKKKQLESAGGVPTPFHGQIEDFLKGGITEELKEGGDWSDVSEVARRAKQVLREEERAETGAEQPLTYAERREAMLETAEAQIEKRTMSAGDLTMLIHDTLGKLILGVLRGRVNPILIMVNLRDYL